MHVSRKCQRRGGGSDLSFIPDVFRMKHPEITATVWNHSEQQLLPSADTSDPSVTDVLCICTVVFHICRRFVLGPAVGPPLPLLSSQCSSPEMFCMFPPEGWEGVSQRMGNRARLTRVPLMFSSVLSLGCLSIILCSCPLHSP